jgi:hypothetical protein
MATLNEEVGRFWVEPVQQKLGASSFAQNEKLSGLEADPVYGVWLMKAPFCLLPDWPPLEGLRPCLRDRLRRFRCCHVHRITEQDGDR